MTHPDVAARLTPLVEGVVAATCVTLTVTPNLVIAQVFSLSLDPLLWG
jgi:hypothetical protein